MVCPVQTVISIFFIGISFTGSFITTEAKNSVSLTSFEKKNVHSSINLEGDDSGSGDRTFTISLATVDGHLYNKMVSMKVGDSLRIKDNGDFILVDNEMDYKNCNFSNPLHFFNNTNANYRLHDSGSFYVISLNVDLCKDGAKMMIKVQERESKPSPEIPHQTSSDSSAAATSSVLNIGIIVIIAAGVLV